MRASSARSEGALIAIVAIACGVLVANIYLSQTLVAPIAADLHVDRAAAGVIVTLTQIGYALGLLFVVPLADSIENKRLAVIAACVALAGLAGIATSRSAAVFFAASMLVGVGSSGAQVLLPMVTHFVDPKRQGRTIGLVMAGLLTGIMLARPVASFVAGSFGWRATFFVAGALTLGVVVMLSFALPSRVPHARTSYGAILRSMTELVATMPVLRWRAAAQASLFAVFNIFWTAAPLILAKQFGFTQQQIALFALAGAGGALAAPFAGRLADSGRGGAAVLGAFVAIALSFAATAGLVAAGTVIGFAIAGVVLDAAVQTNQVISQRVVYALSTHARGRVNAIFLTSIFLFGSAGPALGSWLYETHGWNGVALSGTLVGTILAGAYCVVYARARRSAVAGGALEVR